MKKRVMLPLLLSLATALAGCNMSQPKATPPNQAQQAKPRVTAQGAGQGNPAPATFHLHVIGINDFHGQIDITRQVNGKNAGRADYMAAYLKQRRAMYKNSLLVHAGDAVGASAPASSLLQDEPTINMLNQIGFDVGTLGNHEFDRGVDEMMRLITGGNHPKTAAFKGANFPYVCANVVTKQTGQLILPPYIIKKVQGVPIGIIGVVTSDTPNITMPNNVAGVRFLDEATQINKYTAELKKKGVHAIIVLAHDPGTSDLNGANPQGQVVTIANNVDPDVDVILAGHNHAYMDSVVNNKLVVQAYSYGLDFEDIDLVIDHRTKDIVSKKATVLPVYQDAIAPDPTVKQMIADAEQKVGPIINQVLGTASQNITAAQNTSGESTLGNLIADSQRFATKTQFAFMNPGGIRADLPAGPVTWGELYTIQPFHNDLMTMNLTGAQVRTLLNQQWQKGNMTMLQISGLKYTWDSTRPEGDRVVDIFLPDGSKIDPTASYSVTVNSFLASGGDNFTLLLQGTNRVVGPVDLDACVNYVKQLPQPFSASIEGRAQKLR